ncbi:MAG TPA: hypothetical protein VE077_02335 [Candidatus Methylomirabilis sp.]|nr:hypothetical protein [Candidatus Methylomirabilis sp.]
MLGVVGVAGEFALQQAIFQVYFSSPVSLPAFPADGTKLLVLTNHQTVFQLQVTSDGPKTASN